MKRFESDLAAKTITVTTLALGSIGLLGPNTDFGVAEAAAPCDISGDIAMISSHVRNKTPFTHDVLLPQNMDETDVKAFPQNDTNGEKGLMWNPLAKVCGGKVVRLYEISTSRKKSIGIPHPIQGTHLYVDSVKPSRVEIQGFPGSCECEGIKPKAPVPGNRTLHFKVAPADQYGTTRVPGFTGQKDQRYGEQL